MTNDQKMWEMINKINWPKNCKNLNELKLFVLIINFFVKNYFGYLYQDKFISTMRKNVFSLVEENMILLDIPNITLNILMGIILKLNIYTNLVNIHGHRKLITTVILKILISLK